MDQEVFLIDTNSLVTPFSNYYPFDFAPSFWSQLEENIQNGNIVILDMVKNEILNGNDELKDWMETISFNEIDRREKGIIAEYAKVLQYIQNNPCYKDSALTEWSKGTIADAWIIATAKVYGYTIITFEVGVKMNPKSPSKNAKIPDVAQYFDVKTENLFYLMRKLNFKL